MSVFVEQGTIAATAIVTLEPDRGGNFYCSGAADEVEINAAIVYCAAIGGGDVVLGHGGFVLAATVNVLVGVLLRGMGLTTILNYDAGGNCITFTGDNAKVRDLKIVIVAGAGAGGTRPNGILADTRTNLEVSGVWIVGDLTEADDGSNLRQCGVVFSAATNSRVLNNKIETFERHGVSLNAVSNDNSISQNISQTHNRDGIFADSSNDNTIGDNTLLSNGWDGVNLQTALNNTITGNLMQLNAEGIWTVASTGNTITGNTIQDNPSYGIDITSASHNNVIAGNNIQECDEGILIDSSNDCTLTGNNCNGSFTNGIHITTAVGTSITANILQGTGTFGIYATNASHNTIISSNLCNGNGDTGIDIDACNNLTVTGNTCQGNSIYGIHFNASSGSTLTGNNVQGNGFEGLFLDATSDNNSLTGNTCSGNTRHGIKIDDSDNNIVVGNICNGNDSGDTGTYSGINITDTSLDTLVHSNTCNDNDFYGIDIDDANSARTSVKFNQLRGNTTAPMRNSGTDTRFEGTPFFVANNDQQLGNVPGKTLTNGQSAYIPVHAPKDMQQIMGFHIHVIAQATQANADWDLDTDYAGTGEAYTTHAEADAGSTYNVTDLQWFELDAFAAGMFASMEGGDSGGISLQVSTAGHNVCVVFGHLEFV